MDFRTDILPHRDRLYRLALSMQLSMADAEDVVQDTMLRAWERRDEWQSKESIQAWLMQICKNLVLDRKKRADFHHIPLSGDNGQFTIHNGQWTMDNGQFAIHNSQLTIDNPQFEQAESFALLSRLISELQSPLDDIVRLREFEGLSYAEISKELGLSTDQVRVYLHRARMHLREQYAQITNFGLDKSQS